MKAELLSRLPCLFGHLGCGNWNSKCMSCVRESRNEHDRYAVAEVKDGVVVRHLSKAVSRISSIVST